jgi:transcriptional regulator with XRE-family HTH domain
MISHPVDVHVGKQLRVQRIIMGLSQEALAKAVGITFQQVQKYERGINRMSASRLYDFSRVLGVAVSYFFEGYGNGNQSEASSDSEFKYAAGVAEAGAEAFNHEQVLTRETLELMRCYHRIKNPLIKRRFVDLLRAVSDDKIILEEPEEAA